MPVEPASFSATNEVLRNPPQMSEVDSKRYQMSLSGTSTVQDQCAAARLLELELLPAYRGPYFLVRVANMRAALGSDATALILYKEAQEKLSGKDVIYDQFVGHFEDECIEKVQLERDCWNEGVFNETWKTASKTLFPILPYPPDPMASLQENWKKMSESPGVQRDQFYRYLCVETNCLEEAFSLDSRSVTRLIRDGFEAGNVDFLSQSALQDKDLIIEVLRDTQTALDLILRVGQDPNALTTELYIELHKLCMRGSIILPLKSKEAEEGPFAVCYTNAGVTRQTTCRNFEIPGPPRTQFAPFGSVEEQLDRMTNLGRQWLKNWKRNPFSTSAWLHMVFIICRPFEHGNGRIARLVASIPLIQAGLPPVCIPASERRAYEFAMHKVRQEGDYEPLIQCFVQSLEASNARIQGLSA